MQPIDHATPKQQYQQILVKKRQLFISAYCHTAITLDLGPQEVTNASHNLNKQNGKFKIFTISLFVVLMPFSKINLFQLALNTAFFLSYDNRKVRYMRNLTSVRIFLMAAENERHPDREVGNIYKLNFTSGKLNVVNMHTEYGLFDKHLPCQIISLHPTCVCGYVCYCVYI